MRSSWIWLPAATATNHIHAILKQTPSERIAVTASLVVGHVWKMASSKSSLLDDLDAGAFGAARTELLDA